MLEKWIRERVLHPLILGIRHITLLRGFVVRDIRGQFAGTMAGISWALMNPLATLLTYMFLFSIVIRVQVTAEETGTNSFFIYFATGFIPWLMFSQSLIRATGCLIGNATLITKVIFPVELLPLASVISGMFINGIGLLPLLLYLIFKGFISIIWLYLLIIILLQFLFTLGLSMLFASMCVFLRDINEINNIILMIWFFVTPVIYPISLVPDLVQKFICLNPMYMFVSLYRDAIISHQIDHLLLVILVLVSLLLYSLGSAFFSKVKSGFADVL